MYTCVLKAGTYIIMLNFKYMHTYIYNIYFPTLPMIHVRHDTSYSRGSAYTV